MNTTRTLLPLLAVALLTSGCANKLVFTTKSSIGLDVSGTAEVPNKVSFSYNRQELSIVPRKSNGDAHSVYGGLDADIGFWSGSVIKQTFATGIAADLASGGALPAAAAAATQNTETDSLVFCTATTFGLHLSAGDGQVQPNMLMGYRRGEAAYIPVPDPAQEVRPVYADLLINTKDSDDPAARAVTTHFPSANSGVRIKQSFATGQAAINLARDADVRAKLSKAAGNAQGAIAVLQRRGSELHQEIVLEVSKLSEAQLDAGGDALRASGWFDAAEVTTFRTENSFEKSRILKDIAANRSSEDEIRKLEAYLVELRKINP